MRPPRSIAWQLQLWHGAMLAAVLAAFGVTAWRLERATQLQRVDQELERRVAAVAEALGRGAGPQDQALFGGPRGGGFYYVAWLPDGRELGRSASAPPEVPVPRRDGNPRAWRSRGSLREYVHFTPPGCILVGREVREEQAAMHRFAGLLAATGAVVFALGLAGGAWITRRALRPLAIIGATAGRIAAGDLAQRIPVDHMGGELAGLAGVLNHTFARLQASFARQVRFTADASHELRTPVSVVLTQAQAALARERSAPEYRDALQACLRAARRMRGLIESLLTLARLDSGEAPSRAPCALDRVAAEAVELLRPLAAEQGLALVAELAPVTCPGHPDQLGQVAANLLSNALQHTPSGGRVRVRTAVEAGAAVLSVSDTGEGIAAADLPHVFERFYRADAARAGAAGRTGLGLAIVKAIVEAHGGTVEAASQAGLGSVFTVRLPPLADLQPPGPADGPRGSRGPHPEGGAA